MMVMVVAYCFADDDDDDSHRMAWQLSPNNRKWLMRLLLRPLQPPLPDYWSVVMHADDNIQHMLHSLPKDYDDGHSHNSHNSVAVYHMLWMLYHRSIESDDYVAAVAEAAIDSVYAYGQR